MVPSGNVDTPAAPGHVQEAFSSGQSEPNAADERQVSPTNPSPSAPSISYDAEPGGTTLLTLSKPLPLSVSSDKADNPYILDHVREPARLSTHALDPGSASEDTSNQKPTVPTTPNAILRGIAESSNTYLPLKSVAKRLCSILDNCEVQSPYHIFSPHCLQLCQRSAVNERAIESLASRVEPLSRSLCVPIHVGDINERERENDLKQ
jgi:hypothetical protein